jgi:tRNA wybutosine-synthesizing protein 1
LRVGDDAVGNHLQETFEEWQASVVLRLREAGSNSAGSAKETHSKHPALCGVKESPGSCCSGESSTGECCQSNGHGEVPVASRAETQSEVDENGMDEDGSEYEDDEDDDDREPEVMDLEDMGDSIAASQSKPSTAASGAPPREMVTPSQAKALKKEGYRLIGSHSAVKLCRWTKHQLRGRGGCYKHTFYGITSYQCMEATPSLACANKCVFCWRHHKNPVGKEWRWKTDDPHYIVDEAVKTHVQMIKEARGIPGVQMDRWKEAHTVRHCALSLVGEPIMYPRVDELLADLHSRRISTFLVTNGQHPSAIASLRPITQLYVSVDAPTRESLIAIDRPLFSDAWERLRQSLESLRDKGQRTVARLTVVKGWNSDELEGYARLIALGRVSLVEVKGMFSFFNRLGRF